MKTLKITIKLLEHWGSCYSRVQHIKAFAGKEYLTPLEIVDMEDIPEEDRLWVLLRDEIIPNKELRLFACDCAGRALSRVDNPDKRSLDAVKVSRLYNNNGKLTSKDLEKAWIAAWAEQLRKN